MITEIVTFRLPQGMTREEALAKFRLSIPIWQANPDLIRKAFLFDEASHQGGGVYLWKNIEAAKLAHGAEFQERIRSTYGETLKFDILKHSSWSITRYSR